MNTERLKRVEKTLHANMNQKEGGLAIRADKKH